MIRLHLVSLISPLPPYGFRSNLVPTERSFRGESNGIGCKRFGGELAEDVGNYSEMNRLAQIRDISAFLFRMAARWTSPYASSVLSQLSFVSGRVWSVLEVRKGVLLVELQGFGFL